MSLSPANPEERQSRSTYWAALLLGLALLAAYSNSFRVPFLFDDAPTIVENPTVRSFRAALFPPANSGLTVSGRPVLNLSLAANYAFGGERVASYHATNLAIHFLAALALFGLVRRTLQLPRCGARIRPMASTCALAVSAVWALHPLQTESVTYVVQRAESLAGLFYFLTLYAFVRSVSAGSKYPRVWQVTSMVACFLGMGTKEVMVSAPVLVLLFDRTFVNGSFRDSWRQRKSFYIGLASTWFALGWCVWSTGGRGGTVGFSDEMPWWRYASIQCYAIPHYLHLVVWPYPLVFDYGDRVTPSLGEIMIGATVLAVLGAGTLWALRWKPALGFCGVAFFAVLAPTSSVIPVITQAMAEHRMYLALVPVIVVLVIGTIERWGKPAFSGWFLAAILLGVTTFRRNLDYRNVESIAADTAAKRPGNSRAWCTLAMTLTAQDRLPAAKAAMEEALKVDPDSPEVLVNYAQVIGKTGDKSAALEIYERILQHFPKYYEAHYNMAVILSDLGRTSESLQHLETAIVLKPHAGFAHFNLGNVLVKAGRASEALPHFEIALADQPASADVRNNFANALLGLGRPQAALPILEKGLEQNRASTDLRLTYGLTFLALGRTSDAIRECESVVKSDPHLAKAHADLGLALMTAGKTADACEHYETALRLGKNVGPTAVALALHISLADAWLELGQTQRALEHWQAAVGLDGDSAQIRYHLAHLLLQLGHPSEAAVHYELLVRKDPTFVEAHNDLGLTYAQLGRVEAACAQFEEALRLRPEDAAARANLAALVNTPK